MKLKKMQANRRRVSKRMRREHQRKLKRKLGHIVDEIRIGNYQGVRESPLLRANIPLVNEMLKEK